MLYIMQDVYVFDTYFYMRLAGGIRSALESVQIVGLRAVVNGH